MRLGMRLGMRLEGRRLRMRLEGGKLGMRLGIENEAVSNRRLDPPS